MRPDYDAVIIGARVAGATLATLLARQGARVLLVDKDTLPSDHVMSTHTIHAAGMDVLDEVGVGAEVRTRATPMQIVRVAKDHAHVDIRYAQGRAEYCPRRKRVDTLLQQAAMSAGVELLDHTRVIGLIDERGRVAGARFRSGEKDFEVRSRLLVGADGRHSTVASLVKAEEYLGYDSPRGLYWSYWDPPAGWRSEPRYAFDMYIGRRGVSMRAIFQTDDGQVLLGSAPTRDVCAAWRQDPLGSLKADLATDAATAPLMEGRDPVENVRGTLGERYYFRQAAGPGWALVGDAGHHKDFVIGDGMTEALLQARTLAAAIARNSDAALTRWWRARDVEAMPYFFFGQDEGSAGAASPLDHAVFSGVNRDPALCERMSGIMEHTLSPYDAFPLSKVLKWTLGAALRGQVGVIPQFLEKGKRATAVQQEIEKRRKLLLEST